LVRQKREPAEKPLFWVGSAKDDLLEFPEAMKDGLGIALSVAQFGGSIRRRRRGTWCTRFRRNHPEAPGHPGRMSSWLAGD
jgi:hypothetical protein